MRIEDVMKDLPELKTDRLTLRKFRMEDITDVFEYTSNPEVSKYALWNPHKSLEESKASVGRHIQAYENHSSSIWGVYHNKDEKIIGSAGFIRLDSYFKKGEIGYTLSEKYWGKGYATEIAKKLIDFGFSELDDLHRIEGLCHVDNIPSTKVMEKVGMEQEGVLRGYFNKNGEFLDVRIFSVIKG